jgi:hypothetical protein
MFARFRQYRKDHLNFVIFQRNKHWTVNKTEIRVTNTLIAVSSWMASLNSNYRKTHVDSNS